MKQKNIVELKDRAGISDSLTELLRSGAQQLIHHAVQLELEELLSANAQRLTDQGKAAVV
jgi:hypothetical protein